MLLHAQDVDQLDRLPRLQELRLTGNPLLEQSKTGGRFEVCWGGGSTLTCSHPWGWEHRVSWRLGVELLLAKGV